MEQPRFSTNATPSSPAPGSRGALNALLYLGVYLFSQGLSAALLAGLALVRLINESPGAPLAELLPGVAAQMTERAASLSLFSNLVTLLLLFLVFRLKRQTPEQAAGLYPASFSRLWPLLPLGAALNGLFTTLLSLLPTGMLADYTAASSALLSETGLLPLLAVTLLAPATEEIVFRGLLYKNLSAGVPRVPAALITSALFGLFHGQILWMAYAFLLGLLLCLVCDWYGSTLGALLLHMAFNLSGGASAALSLLPPWAALALSLTAAVLFLFLTRQKARAPGD